ncbi:MAG: Mur ligase family protein [Lachnospirales bacterium]
MERLYITINFIFSLICAPILAIIGIKMTIHHLQMFQQNSYRIKRYEKYYRENNKRYFINELILIAGIVFTLLGVILSYNYNETILYISLILKIIITAILVLWASIVYLKPKKSIIPIKYTWRVKRLFLTLLLLNFLLFYIGLNSPVFIKYITILLILVGATPYLMILASLINTPLEKYIANTFVKDAKRMLLSHKNLIVIGITGSYGKTSMKNYLTKLLSVKYETLMTPESYNTPMGVVRTIRESLKGTTEIFVCEMGAKEKNNIKEICDIVNPDHGIITAIGPQHLETFKTIETVISTKFELVDAIDDGILLLNGDNEYILKNLPKKNHLLYSVNESSNYRPYDVTLSAKGTTFTLETEREKCVFTTKLIGEHNLLNIVGAIMMCNKLGISLEDLKSQVAKIEPVPHRLEIKKGEKITIIDDAFNSNPQGAKAALNTLSYFEGQKILISPGMVELGTLQEEANYQFAKESTKVCDYIILVGERQTKPMQKALIDESFPKSNYYVAKSFIEAMEYAKTIPCEENIHKYILIENDLPDNYLK